MCPRHFSAIFFLKKKLRLFKWYREKKIYLYSSNTVLEVISCVCMRRSVHIGYFTVILWTNMVMKKHIFINKILALLNVQ